MYNSHPANTSGSSRKKGDRFKGTWMPNLVQKKNGRKKRSSVGDPQQTWRIKKVSQKALLLVFIPIMLLCTGWSGYVMLLRSDIFRMTEVLVKGNQVMEQQRILNSAGIRRGMNLLSMDVDHLEALISQEQWVEKVWIKRQWPSTVEIVIREYKPFALLNLEEKDSRQLYYVDSQGVVFAPSSAEKDLDYPVINGSFSVEDLLGKKLPTDSLGAMALEFLRLTAKGNQILPTQAVSEISVSPEEGLIVYLIDHPFPIYMGKEKIRVRFQRLVKVLAKLYKGDKIKGVAEIRMNYAEKKILVTRVDEA